MDAFLYDLKCSFILFQGMGLIFHFLYFDAFQGAHEFQQKTDTAFEALDFCHHIAVFHIFYPSRQFQPFCQLFQFKAKAHMLHPAGKSDMTADEAIFLKIGQFDFFDLMDDIVVSVFFECIDGSQGNHSFGFVGYKKEFFPMFLQLYKEEWDLSSIFPEKDGFSEDKFCFWVCVFGKIYYNKMIHGIMPLVWRKT